jgi:hypothetical protein
MASPSSWTEHMTEREKRLVADQMQKQADRVARMFGYDKAWRA